MSWWKKPIKIFAPHAYAAGAARKAAKKAKKIDKKSRKDLLAAEKALRRMMAKEQLQQDDAAAVLAGGALPHRSDKQREREIARRAETFSDFDIAAAAERLDTRGLATSKKKAANIWFSGDPFQARLDAEVAVQEAKTMRTLRREIAGELDTARKTVKGRRRLLKTATGQALDGQPETLSLLLATTS